MAQKLNLTPIEEPQKLNLKPLNLTPIDEEPKKKTTNPLQNIPPIENNKSYLRRFWDYVNEKVTLGADEEQIERLHDILPGSKFVHEFATPLNLATLGTASLAKQAAVRGAPKVARGLDLIARSLSAPVALEGGATVLSSDATPLEKMTGVIQLFGGGMGMRSNIGNIGKQTIDDAPQLIRDIVDEKGNTINLGAPLNPAKQVSNAPIIGQEIWLKKPTIENLKKARAAGYEFVKGGIRDSDGAFKMKYTGNKDVPVLETDVATSPGSNRVGKVADLKKSSPVLEAINLPRALMASFDFSAPFRQGIGLIHKKAWWNSWKDMFKSFGSENAFRAVQEDIASRELFKSRGTKVIKKKIKQPDGTFKIEEVKKPIQSFAEEAGLKLTDLTDLSSREEAIMSTWAEKIPGIGRGVRASNRAYTAFLNKLRADTFDDLIKNSSVFKGDKPNMAEAKELANFINTATGRGRLYKGKYIDLESSAAALNSTLFSPRLIASRLKYADPRVYLTGSPQARKEYLKSLFAIGAVGNSIVGLSKLIGAEIETDPASSDFMKPKFGNVRLDPWAGFQQYGVLLNRLSPNSVNPFGGRMKSSIPNVFGQNNEYFLNDKLFGRSTRADVLQRFGESKLHPSISLAWGLLKGKDALGQPIDASEETVRRFVPIFLQDLKELINENPDLLGDYDFGDIDEALFALPSLFGMSSQKYGPNK